MENSTSFDKEKTKKFVLILRDLRRDEEELIRSISNNSSVYIQQEEKESLVLKNSKNVQEIDLSQLYEQTYEHAFRQILDFTELELEDGGLLAEVLKSRSDGNSWWYYFRFMALYKYRVSLYDFRLSKLLIELLVKYEEVYVFHSSKNLHNLLLKSMIKTHYYTAKTASKKRINIAKYIIASSLRVLIGFSQLHYLFRRTEHILLTNATVNQVVLQKKSLKEIKGDHFSEYLQEEIQNEDGFLNVSEFFPPKLNTDKELEFSKQLFITRYKRVLHIEVILFIQLFNPWFYYRAFKEISHLKRVLSRVRLANSASEEEKFIIPIVFSFKRLCYFLSIRKAALYWFFKVKKIQSIGGVNEHDSRVRSILEVAKSSGTKTYGIQHGVIHSRHMHYCFTDADMKHNPTPDYTFLWGEYWKNTLLISSKYKESGLITVGQLRSDIILSLSEVPKSELFRELDANKITILYPSQPLYTGEEAMRKRLANDFLRLSKKFRDIQFVIKPHPKETDSAKFIQEVADEIGTSNYLILESDLYKTLAVSDLVIVYNSTVGAESIYFNKPLLVMDYSNNDFSGYIGAGVGIRVDNYEVLQEKIKDFIKGKQLANQEAIDYFIHQRAYKVDGKVSERVINQLKEL